MDLAARILFRTACAVKGHILAADCQLRAYFMARSGRRPAEPIRMPSTQSAASRHAGSSTSPGTHMEYSSAAMGGDLVDR